MEIAEYLQQMLDNNLLLNKSHISAIFGLIDDDGDGHVDKEEMECFLRVLMVMNSNLKFKPSKTFIRKEVARKFEQKR